MARPDLELRCVTEKNNYKYYKFHDNGNGTFTATYGRIGKPPQSVTYSIDKWDAKYREKLKKGYEDVTDTLKVVSTEYASVSDATVNALLNEFLACSRQYVSKFTNAQMISDTGAAEAQDLINKMSRNVDIKDPDSSTLNEFNAYLIKLLGIVPRIIKNVKDALAKSLDDRTEIIQREQSLLDNMITLSKAAPASSGKATIEDAFGFSIRTATPEEFDMIKDKLEKDGGVNNYKLTKVFVVGNPKRDADFEEYLKSRGLKNNKTNVKMYWHGSGTENILSILANGILIRPANASHCGSAFGVGAYHAPQPDKAFGYTSGGGWRGGSSRTVYMFVNAVIMGKPFDVKDNYETYNGIKIYNLDGDKFESQNLGYHSVYAHRGGYLRRDEAIVYNQSQVACRYLCEFQYK